MPETETWTVGRLLAWTEEHFRKSGSESPRLDAEILLAKARRCERIELYMAFDEELPEGPRALFRELVRRRGSGAPVAYLVGRREFYSLDFEVTADVLIPRPETELVVVAVLDALKEMQSASQTPDEPEYPDAPSQAKRELWIADVGTGSGAIAVSVAKACGDCRAAAIDLSGAALAVAGRNAAAHGVAARIELIQSDLFAAVPPERRFAIIASNPPYVSEAEYAALPREVKDHEPRTALVAGPQGTEIIERLLDEAAARLAAGGRLIVEVSPMIAPRVEQLVGERPSFVLGPTLRDLAGRPRVVQARWGAANA